MGPSDEVAALVATTRSLVGEAHRLSRSLDETVLELEEFTQDLRTGDTLLERRMTDQPYQGEDRRRA